MRKWLPLKIDLWQVRDRGIVVEVGTRNDACS